MLKKFTITTSALSPVVNSYTGYSSLTTSVSTMKLSVLGIKEYNTAYLIEVLSFDSIVLESTGPPIPTPLAILIPTQNDVLTVLDPYFIGNFDTSDCNAIINNDLIARQSGIFWDVDYSSNAIQAGKPTSTNYSFSAKWYFTKSLCSRL